MFASIQSAQFYNFCCRVKQEPVITQGNIYVYELVDSEFPNDIVLKVNGRHSGVFRHVALDENSIGYLYDFENKTLRAKLGLCQLINDSKP